MGSGNREDAVRQQITHAAERIRIHNPEESGLTMGPLGFQGSSGVVPMTLSFLSQSGHQFHCLHSLLRYFLHSRRR